MRRFQLIIALVTFVGVAVRVEGQGVADLPSGARVRITLPDSVRPTARRDARRGDGGMWVEREGHGAFW